MNCSYPRCNCPFDAPADPAWCARGLPQAADMPVSPAATRDTFMTMNDAQAAAVCPEATAQQADTEAQKIDAARTAAHRAADAAERAWYELAGLLDVGPDRTRAFTVYENLRHARRL